jgi:hypothetical protein
MSQTVCFLCSQPGHTASRCHELSNPLTPGFHSGGGGGHSHDGEDDQCSFGRDTHLTVFLAGLSDSTDFSEFAGLEEREFLGVVGFEEGLDDCLDDDND